MAYDGEVEIGMKLSTADIKKTASELEKTVKSVLDKSAGTKLDSKLQKIETQLTKNISKSNELTHSLERMESLKTPTDEFKKLEDTLESLKKKQLQYYDSIEQRKKELGVFLKVTETNKDSESYKRAKEEYDAIIQKQQQYEQEIEKTKQEIQNLIDTGKVYKLGTDDPQYEKTKNQLESLNNETRLLLNTWDQLMNKEDEASTKTSRFASSWQNVKNVLGSISRSTLTTTKNIFTRLGSVIKKATINMLSFAKASKKVASGGRTVGMSMKRLFTTMLALGLGIHGLQSLFTKLRSAMTEGIKNVVRWQGESGKLNKSLSSISSAFATLKNSIGAAISPLVNAFAPALVNIINLITDAANKVGMFIAALTGQKTFLMAETVQKNFADELDKTGKNAKKAKKELDSYLSPIDELNKLQKSNEEDSSDSGVGSTGTFKEVAIDPRVLDFIDRIKKMWEEGNFYELGKEWGEKLRDALESIPWDTIRETSNKIGKSLASLINGFVEVERLAHDIGNTVAQGINTVFEFLNGFVHELHWDSIGSFIAETFNGFFEGIDWELIKDTIFTGIQGVVDAVNAFIRDFHWDNISITVGEIIDIIVGAIETVFDPNTGVKFRDLGYNLGEQLKNIIKDLPEDEIGETLGHVLHGIVQFAIGFLKGSEGGFSMLVQKMKGLISAMWNSLTEEDKQFLGKSLMKILIYIITFAVGKAVISQAVTSLGTKILGAIFGTGGAAAAGSAAGSAFIKSFVPAVLAGLLGLEVAGEAKPMFYDMFDNIALFFGADENRLARTRAKLEATYEDNIFGVLKMMKDSVKAIWTDTDELLVDPWVKGTPMFDSKVLADAQKQYESYATALKVVGKEVVLTQEEYTKLFTEYVNNTAKDYENITTKGYDFNKTLTSLANQNVTTYEDVSVKIRQSLAETGTAVDTLGREVSTESVDMADNFGDSTTRMQGELGTLEKSTESTKQSFNALADAIIHTSKQTIIDATNMTAKMREELARTGHSIQVDTSSVKSSVSEVSTSTNDSAFNFEQSTTKIKTSMSSLQQLIKTESANIVTSVTDMTKSVTTNIADIVKKFDDANISIINDLKTLVQNVKDAKTSLDGIVKEIKNLFTKDKWNMTGIREGLADSFNLAIKSIKTIWSQFADWMNDRLHIEIDTSKVFGQELAASLGTSRLDIGKIPRLAQGAVIPANREFLAVLGDQKSGTNIEAPLQTMVDAFNQALAQNGGNGQSITLNLMLPDKRTIAQYAIEGGQVLQMSRGRNPFLLERG